MRKHIAFTTLALAAFAANAADNGVSTLPQPGPLLNVTVTEHARIAADELFPLGTFSTAFRKGGQEVRFGDVSGTGVSQRTTAMNDGSVKAERMLSNRQQYFTVQASADRVVLNIHQAGQDEGFRPYSSTERFEVPLSDAVRGVRLQVGDKVSLAVRVKP